MKYFRDVDNGNIVRKPDEGMYLEYTFKGAKGWLKTEPDSSYEREYWLGEGNTCLFDLDEDEALAAILSWSEFLCEKHILNAKECFLFGDDTVYVVLKDNDRIFAFNICHKVWMTRSTDGFWDSWDFSPELFLPISNEEALAKIYFEEIPIEEKKKPDVSASVESKKVQPTDNIIEQMVDGIVGKESPQPTEREKEIRNNLSGRAWEYLMFMDDDDE